MGQEYASLRFEPERFLHPAYREYIQRAARLPAIFKDSLLNMLQHPRQASLSQLIGELGKLDDILAHGRTG